MIPALSSKYSDFMTNPKSYDACRGIWRRMLQAALRGASEEWRFPWYGERYGNGRLVRDGTMATAVAADWSRGVAIEQIEGGRGRLRDIIWFEFELTWILAPRGFDSPGIRRLDIRCTLSKKDAAKALAHAWVAGRVSEVELIEIGNTVGAKTNPNTFRLYKEDLKKHGEGLKR